MQKPITRREFLRYVPLVVGAAALSCALPSAPLLLATPTALPAGATATGPVPPGATATASGPSLTYVAGSSIKLEQLVGETDKQRHQPTLSQTFTRYGLLGTDMGQSFEHNGRAYFLFGDTVGRLDRDLDTIATTDAVDPEQGVRLDFLTSGSDYLTIQPPGISMGGFEVPTAGISLGGQMYFAVRTNHSVDWSSDRSMLIKFTLPKTFQPLRTISQSPAGRFINLSFHAEPGSATLPGLPPGSPFVFIWGTARARQSDAYLQIVPTANFESGQGTRYFAGLEAGGAPVWSASEADAKAVVTNGTMGDLSVTWCSALNLWLMNFDSRAPAPDGILLAYSRSPWGPWSEPQVIFNDVRDGGLGKFIHDPAVQPDDGLAGPINIAGQTSPAAVKGNVYAPYFVERWTKVQDSELNLYYVMSTWNPYVVVLMKSRLAIG